MKDMKERDIIKFKGELGRVIVGQSEQPEIGRIKNTKGMNLFLPAGTGRYWEAELDIITKDDVTETSLEEKIVYLKMGFHWGTITSVEIINKGEYVIFESRDGNGTSFHSYLNFEDIRKGSTTLDGAIINLLAHKYDGCNNQAGYMFERMLKMQ